MGDIQDKLEKLYNKNGKEELLLESFLQEDDDEDDGKEEDELKDADKDYEKNREKEKDDDIEECNMKREQEDRPDISPADEKAAEKEYGKVEFADQPNKKYPIDLKHIQAALSYFGMPKNYEKYSAADRKTVARKIASTAEKFGKDVTEFRKKFGI